MKTKFLVSKNNCLHFCRYYCHRKLLFYLTKWYFSTNLIFRLVNTYFLFSAKAATTGVLWKKVFLEISQNSQENTCARVSLIKLKVSGLKFSGQQLLLVETLCFCSEVFFCYWKLLLNLEGTSFNWKKMFC